MGESRDLSKAEANALRRAAGIAAESAETSAETAAEAAETCTGAERDKEAP